MDALPTEFFRQGLCNRTAEKIDNSRCRTREYLSPLWIETPSNLDGVSFGAIYQEVLICCP